MNEDIKTIEKRIARLRTWRDGCTVIMWGGIGVTATCWVIWLILSFGGL